MLLISFGYYAYQVVYTPNILVGKQPRPLVIPRGASFKDVQDLLHRGDYTQDLISFSFLSKLMEYDENVKPGRYVLKPNLSNLEAIRLLRAGIQEPVNVT
ncbi:MAG TPA: endolytic transglycosylase MltG, partial [Chryseosolibacter sp.]|nr:endolytic transglycosylase MltG [Chryseosolibacter sp.]